ncbi:MAG: hypothetical protein ACD_13C00144G0048 [uncultured bacterium]|nr:MAG: hypothetical protein ACD_13C00144G0048 [uncultured bacterium]HAU65342.1 hypothetical protein [Candidatus Woesebacteria bacterium]HCC08459.1 hypothetical protein [Candidatus Woesebacteria bacterium]
MRTKIIQFTKSKYFEYILLSIMLVLGFTVRLYKINNPVADWHSWRQSDTASVSRVYLENGINLLLPRYHDISSIQTGMDNPQGYRMVEFPFYNALNVVLAKSFTSISLEVWARLLTISIAVVSAFFLYLIGKRLMGKYVGLLSAFFYLFIPYNIYFTRVILPDPMGVMFGVISLWAFLEFTHGNKKALLFISSVFFAMALLIKPYLGFYLFPIIYLAIKKYGIKSFFKEKRVILGTLAYLAVAFIPFLLWRGWEAKFPEGIPFYEWAFNGNLIRFKPSWWYWIFGERLGHLILGSLGLIPFTFGVLNTKVKNLFIQAFLGGTLFYVAAVANANVMHDYYQILSIPAIALAVASGTVFLWEGRIFNKILTRIIVVISIGVMLITGWNQIVGNFNINHPEIMEAGEAVDRVTPKDALIVAPYNGDTAFLYQTKRFGWPAIDNSIDNIIEEGADYYVSVNLGSKDTKMIEARFKTVEKTDKYIIIDLNKPIK